MEPVRVVVIDDHEIVRSGLSSILAREPDIHLVGSSESGELGLDLIEEVRPRVAVVDYSLPGMSGVEVCETISRRYPEVGVIILTTLLDDEVVRGSVNAGAKAFVYKDVEGEGLKRAIRKVARGESVIDSKAAGRVAGFRGRAPIAMRKAVLSAREVDILRLVARGLSNQEISAELGLSVNSVKTFLQRALAKLGCHSRSEAAAQAARRGLL